VISITILFSIAVSFVGFAGINFGLANDKLTPADFDGDGKTDIAVFRDGNWFYLRSSDNAFRAVQFGSSGDIPVPSDCDGDGRADVAVFRQGNWYIQNSSNNQSRAVQFGISSDQGSSGGFRRRRENRRSCLQRSLSVM